MCENSTCKLIFLHLKVIDMGIMAKLWALFKHTNHLETFDQALSQDLQMHSGILARKKRIQLLIFKHYFKI